MNDSLAHLVPSTRSSIRTGDGARRSQLPRLPTRLVRRPRLERRLDQPAAVTLVEGEAGYGKTTLLASWLEDQAPTDLAVVWVTGSPGLDRPNRFWAHLGRRLAALGVVAPGGDDLAVGLGDALLGQPALVVLDDFDHVRDPRILHGLVELARAHRSLRLCIASRTRHPIAELAMAALDVVDIGPSELLLDDHETVALARSLGKGATVAQARWLQEVTGGWVAITRTVLEAAEPGEPLSVAMDRCLDASLAASSGVREALRRMFPGGRAFDHPHALRELHARVARWYLSNGGPAQSIAALEHAVVAGDPRLVVDVWARHGVTLLPQAPALLSTVLAGLPESVVSARPALGVARRMADTLADGSGPPAATAALRAYAEASLEVAEGEAAGMAEADALFLATGRMTWFRLHGQLDRALTLAASLDLAFTPQEAPVGALRDWLAWFHLQQGATYLAAGRDRAAAAGWERAWQLAQPDARRALPAFAVASLALVHALAGRVEPARRWLDEYRTLDPDETELSRLASDVAHLALGWLALDRLEPLAVLGELERLGGAAASELWPLLAALEATHAVHFGDPLLARAQLDAAAAGHPEAVAEQGAFGILLDRARVDLLLAHGDIAAAKQVLRRQRAPQPALKVAAARIHLLAGDHAAACGGPRDPWDHGLSARDRLELLLIQAVASLRSGQSANATYLVRLALELFRTNPLLRPWATLTPGERDELLDLAGERLPPDAVERLAQHPPLYAPVEVSVSLTHREQVVLAALAQTGSRRDIADTLYVSVNTVKVQLGSLYRKLGVSTRDAALARARHLGLLDVAR